MVNWPSVTVVSAMYAMAKGWDEHAWPSGQMILGRGGSEPQNACFERTFGAAFTPLQKGVREPKWASTSEPLRFRMPIC